jgi:hypothetical protein
MYEKMLFRCKCGELFETNWHEFNSKKFPKRQCNKCGRKRTKETKRNNNLNFDKPVITCEYISNYLKENGYTCKLISTEYINCDSKLEFECECGNHFFASWSNIKKMSGLCKKCAMSQISHEDYVKRISKYLDRFELMSRYESSEKEVCFRCKKCNSIIRQRAKHTYERGIYCHCCDGTKGEQYISNYLLIKKINFISQYKFEDCKNINSLPFDFYLPDYNVCIEYQGVQHYKPVDYFGGEESYNEQVFRDNIKRQYCRDNNIILLEISYKDLNNIEDVLDSTLLCGEVVA